MPKLATKLKDYKPKQARKEPLWKGPCDTSPLGGITFSMLSKFLCCRERFRLQVIEGLRAVDSFNIRMEYGNMWHACEEAHAAEKDWIPYLFDYCKKLGRKYPMAGTQITHWYNICFRQFPIYVDYWAKHPDVKSREGIEQEQVFAYQHKLPSGRQVVIRGKRDAVDLVRVNKVDGIYLQENKSKGDIDVDAVTRQLTFDLQTMMYLLTLEDGQRIDGKFYPTRGVRYNVIRRPLAGGKFSIKQCKGRKTKKGLVGQETLDEFYDRLEKIMIKECKDAVKEKRESFFFVRRMVEITPSDMQKFLNTCLNPILENLCDWYAWVARMDDPWETVQSLHYRWPYGVFNATAEGMATEVDRYLESGDESGLVRVDNLFGELQ